MAKSFSNLPNITGDELSRAFVGTALEKIMEDNHLEATPAFLEDPNKNPGMKRMIVGNVLRGRIRRGEYVKVGNHEFNAPTTSH